MRTSDPLSKKKQCLKNTNLLRWLPPFSVLPATTNIGIGVVVVGCWSSWSWLKDNDNGGSAGRRDRSDNDDVFDSTARPPQPWQHFIHCNYSKATMVEKWCVSRQCFDGLLVLVVRFFERRRWHSLESHRRHNNNNNNYYIIIIIIIIVVPIL